MARCVDCGAAAAVEWQDLPPVARMEDAVVRNRLSKGISYLLPVDTERISVDCEFRTDLRGMFQEPYLSDDAAYDDVKVKSSAKHHFNTNLPNSSRMKHFSSPDYTLNAESEKVRRLYAQSVPAANGFHRSNLKEMQARSGIFVPIKPKLTPEAEKMLKYVDNLLKSKRDKSEDQENDNGLKNRIRSTAGRTTSTRWSVSAGTGRYGSKQHTIRPSTTTATFCRKIHKQITYEQMDFKDVPPFPELPREFISPYMSKEKFDSVWKWLHFGEELSEFEYFLKLCD